MIKRWRTQPGWVPHPGHGQWMSKRSICCTRVFTRSRPGSSPTGSWPVLPVFPRHANRGRLVRPWSASFATDDEHDHDDDCQWSEVGSPHALYSGSGKSPWTLESNDGPELLGAPHAAPSGSGPPMNRLLGTLERLLAIDETDLHGALDRACHMVAEALRADKVDVAHDDSTTESLV